MGLRPPDFIISAVPSSDPSEAASDVPLGEVLGNRFRVGVDSDAALTWRVLARSFWWSIAVMRDWRDVRLGLDLTLCKLRTMESTCSLNSPVDHERGQRVQRSLKRMDKGPLEEADRYRVEASSSSYHAADTRKISSTNSFACPPQVYKIDLSIRATQRRQTRPCSAFASLRYGISKGFTINLQCLYYITDIYSSFYCFVHL